MDDPFDDVLNLEDNFYEEGYKQGEVDGKRAGQVEGRTLGLENGFKKFVESGRLYGKTVVWGSRLGGSGETSSSAASAPAGPHASALTALPRNARLQKNIRAVYALVEPGTLSTANTDEAVNDFDDRVKRAQGKARVVEKMLGELSSAEETSPAARTSLALPPVSAASLPPATTGGRGLF